MYISNTTTNLHERATILLRATSTHGLGLHMEVVLLSFAVLYSEERFRLVPSPCSI